MATQTTNYGLKKPAQEDFYNVDDFNGNFDAIDKKMKEIEEAANDGTESEEISNKIGTTGDTGGSQTAGTVMGKLNKVIANTEAAAENTEAFASIKCGSIASAQEVVFAFKEINAIANDSENDLTITLYNAAGASAGQFVIKQDETLSAVRFAGSKIAFAGTEINARYILLG